MKLTPETLNRSRPQRGQLELDLRTSQPQRRQYMDICPRCRCMHTSKEAEQACRSLVAQREQL